MSAASEQLKEASTRKSILDADIAKYVEGIGTTNAQYLEPRIRQKYIGEKEQEKLPTLLQSRDSERADGYLKYKS